MSDPWTAMSRINACLDYLDMSFLHVLPIPYTFLSLLTLAKLLPARGN
jgi:hypothetical protein